MISRFYFLEGSSNMQGSKVNQAYVLDNYCSSMQADFHCPLLKLSRVAKHLQNKGMVSTLGFSFMINYFSFSLAQSFSRMWTTKQPQDEIHKNYTPQKLLFL